MSTTYKKIRFIGYAIPTTPAKLVTIGDPNGPGAVAGTYLAHSSDPTDMQNRIAIMKNAVDTAKKKLPLREAGIVNVFVAPEFFFHGIDGPYIYKEASSDPIKVLGQQLSEVFDAANYPNWTFVFGSAITAMLKDKDRMLSSNASLTRNSVVENLSKQWQASFGPLKSVILPRKQEFENAIAAALLSVGLNWGRMLTPI